MSCPACFQGTVHSDHVPTGHEAKTHGFDTYIAEPPNGAPPNGIIVIVPDAFGWQFVNNRRLADHYASKGGYTVYLPEFMNGTAAPVWVIDSMAAIVKSGATLWENLAKPYHTLWTLTYFVPFLVRNRLGVTMPKVQRFVEQVRLNEGANLPIGAAGFCWGGPHVVRLASGLASSDGKPIVDASFTAHPSSLDIPGEIVGIKKPVSFAIGDEDPVISMKQVAILEGELKKLNVKTELVMYPGGGHGFGVRADPNNKQQAEHAAQAEEQALKFFSDTFKERS